MLQATCVMVFTATSVHRKRESSVYNKLSRELFHLWFNPVSQERVLSIDLGEWWSHNSILDCPAEQVSDMDVDDDPA